MPATRNNDFAATELTGDNFSAALENRQALPAATSSTADVAAQAGNVQTPFTQLRTSASVNGAPSLGVSMYSVSDIMQGAGLYRGSGLMAEQFNQQLSGDMQAIVTTGGGADSVLGLGRARFTPYDILAHQGRTDGKIQFERGGAQAAATNGQMVNAADPITGAPTPGDYVEQPDGSETHPHSTLGSVTVQLWRGFKMEAGFLARFQPLWFAAQGDGLELSGGGFRTEAGQIALRKENCPDWQNSRSSDCSPPTAKPGQSNHEKGMAVDLENASTRSTEVYQWMAANAESFGIYNLPSEAWHWSIDGN
jgi:hypothetical protein